MGVEIDVVIPSYNRRTLVGRAIESVLQQSHPPDHIILVDDGSTDGTGDWIREKYPDIVYVFQENAGGAAARNRGMCVSEAKWIAFLDSDDVWTADHLERMTWAIKATAGSAILYFSDMQMDNSWGSTRLWERSGFAPSGSFAVAVDGTEWAFRDVQPMMLQSSVVHRGDALRLGGFRNALRRRHDTDFFFRVSIGHRVCAVAGVGACMLDDARGARLTTTWDTESPLYTECTITIYRAALSLLWRRSRVRNREFIREARTRLQVALLRTAKQTSRSGNPVRAARALFAGVVLDPWRAISRAIGRWTKTTRQ